MLDWQRFSHPALSCSVTGYQILKEEESYSSHDLLNQEQNSDP